MTAKNNNSASRNGSDDKNGKKLRVAILATDGFEEAELVEPRNFLDKEGAETVLIAPKAGKIGAMKHDVKSGSYKVDQVLGDADPNDFDAVLLPGGAMNADALRVESKAQKFVREINDQGKPIAFICHAPWLLVSAGLVNGRRLTSYHTIRNDIENAGGKWTNAETVSDANWVSSRQPDDIPAFNQAMKKLFWGAAKNRSDATRSDNARSDNASTDPRASKPASRSSAKAASN